MPYSLALTAGAQAQNEGNGGGAGTWTYTLTRTGGDINGVDQQYSYRIFNADTTPSDDFTIPAAGAFTWVGGATTRTFTFTANQDFAVEPNENPVIWFYSNNTSAGVNILSNQDVSTNTLTITNDDTGAPVFSTAAAVNAAENATTALTLAATAGGTAVTYTKTGVGADQALFTVNAATGEVTWAAQNFEAPGDAGADRVYNLQVRATAGGATTDLDLAITLTNVNEAPVITSDGGGDTAVGNPGVAENTTAVLTATATDVDASDTLTWSISGGADAGKFTINPQTGVLAFASPPNFEALGSAAGTNSYTLQIKATDAAGLNDTQTVNVAVTNADDPAVISSYSGADLLFISAPENTLTTTTLATVAATDNDAGGTVTYSLVGPDAGRFAVSAGGLLTFAPSPDFELPGDVGTDNVYDVTVRATPGSGAVDDQRFLVFVTNVVEAGETSSGGGGFTPPTVPTTPTPPAVGPGNDSMLGTDFADVRSGGEGNDTIDGGAGNDSLDGDNGDDSVQGGEGDDFIRGLNGDDDVYGGAGADTVNGNQGDDDVYGGDGADVVYGGQGQDLVFGGEGDDSYVNGNMGNDTVHGDGGADSVYGGQNDDIIYGDGGNDLLSGDLGNDLMYGGDGADRFTITATGGSDWVIDFNGTSGDRIQLAPGTAYSIGSYQGQVLITVGGTATIGLAGISVFDPSWVIFG